MGTSKNLDFTQRGLRLNTPKVPVKIILIEDDAAARASFAKMLMEAGHDVIIADCGKLGLAKLRQYNAEVLVTEVMMAGMDGLEVIKSARSGRPDLWIVSISGEGNLVPANTALTLARAFGADRILYRPFEKSELLAALERG